MKTKVIFRVFEDGDVIALFPDVPWNAANDVSSYMRVGQHGAASADLIYELRPATKKEYEPLLKELRAIGYKNLIIERGSK